MINQDLKALIHRLPSFSRTRFAPSPTGFLHLGHVTSALFVWLIARVKGAEIVLRIEDHDQSRMRPHFTAQIFEDLNFLKLVPDHGNNMAMSPYIQSQHLERYNDLLPLLQTYSCDCSRKTIETRMGSPSSSSELAYDGFCRHRGLTSGALRLLWDPEPITFWDCRLGEFTHNPKQQCGDLLLREKNQNYTYQFSVVVDDYIENIDFIIRGADLLESTGRQLRLHEMIGNATYPKAFHHPLVYAENGEKLSKRDLSESIQDWVRKGLTSEQIMGKAAYLSGLWLREESISFEDLLHEYKSL
ncbi:MAG: glutamate--tRNA ligase family protein [Pseudomonadota bacterium]